MNSTFNLQIYYWEQDGRINDVAAFTFPGIVTDADFSQTINSFYKTIDWNSADNEEWDRYTLIEICVLNPTAEKFNGAWKYLPTDHVLEVL